MAKVVPSYTFTGEHSSSADDNYWYIRLTSSGTFAFTGKGQTVDVFLVGGGASGTLPGGGGGGGYAKTVKEISVDGNTEYPAAVGAGSAFRNGGGPTWGSQGGTTSIFSQSVTGGHSTGLQTGGAGGSGGGAGDNGYPAGSRGGSNGGAGSGWRSGNGQVSYNGGSGQGTTTRAFGEANGELFAGGGGGCTASGGSGGGGAGNVSGSPNTGGGGGGVTGSIQTTGGSGIIIIRGAGESVLPVNYNGVDLTEIRFVDGNNEPVSVTSLIYNGYTVF